MWQLFLMALGYDYINDGEHPEGNPRLNRFALLMLLAAVVGVVLFLGWFFPWLLIRTMFSF